MPGARPVGRAPSALGEPAQAVERCSLQRVEHARAVGRRAVAARADCDGGRAVVGDRRAVDAERGVVVDHAVALQRADRDRRAVDGDGGVADGDQPTATGARDQRAGLERRPDCSRDARAVVRSGGERRNREPVAGRDVVDGGGGLHLVLSGRAGRW